MTDLASFDDLELHWESSEEMSAVEDGSVQSVVTSPPYWDLKDYGHEQQIGTTDESYDEYHDRLQSVWTACYDALCPSGTLWIVVDTVMDRGDLQLLPYHVVQRAEEVGFRLQDIVKWYKPTAIAGMSDRNVVNKKEYVLFFSKHRDHKFRHRQPENGPEDPAVSADHRLGNVWRFPVKRGTAGQNVLHKAPFPTALSDRITRLSTDPGDTVLDPFLGSGTTAVSALQLDRTCVGYELNDEFAPVVRRRLAPLRQRSLAEF